MTELLPCPFCGGNASFEHLENTRWSIGCADIDGDCMGFQSLQTFSRKAEALAAWNRRPTSAGQSEEVEQRNETLDQACKRVTRESIRECLTEIERAFDNLLADRNEWREQHENLVGVRQADLSALDLPAVQREARREVLEEAAKVAETYSFWQGSNNLADAQTKEWIAAAIRAIKEGTGDAAKA